MVNRDRLDIYKEFNILHIRKVLSKYLNLVPLEASVTIVKLQTCLKGNVTEVVEHVSRESG